ncbi:MBL fold metallo-hydrolase [Pyrococcus abyssi]|uniref:Hydrolase, metallo-beta-lactamase superfamily n=1 Tax=Pyrococcus abyssi (strain GE5 / Orsay) TaxID=272844 RepID=Q9V090_PYRAB|nr:MBL fold metallo-hydrolase [Pyrococcus abyssi]CAB49815.1 Metallo-beta-lactamase superfamily protein, putative [Pyrococcus abyssi GE5]CCE70309.1 TPA: Hydrolase, metallo-beta-lactamase superfamily [Pyrococcus abyssi GE5]
MTRLIILNDNVPSKGLMNDWGWSVLVEGRKRFLFDADTNPLVLAHNSKALNVNLRNLDFAVLSHWHYDHYGGFQYIAELNPGIKFYAPIQGLAMAMRWGFQPIAINSAGEIEEGVYTSGVIDGIEQAVGVETSSGLIVIVGCSHPGVDRMVQKVLEASGYKRAYLVIGGFHSPPIQRLRRLAELSELIAPAHCSGEMAKMFVRKNYGERYVEVRTGTILEV